MGDAAGRIFLSYRREDTRHVAGRLADRLNSRFGAGTVFMDVDVIELGADFTKAIATEVAACHVLIALIGQDWLTPGKRTGQPRIFDGDDFVAVEIAAALDRGIRVIPVLTDEARMPTADELPPRLRPLATRNAARLDHETFSSDIERLLSTVGQILQASAAELTARHRKYPSQKFPPAPGPTPEHSRPNGPEVDSTQPAPPRERPDWPWRTSKQQPQDSKRGPVSPTTSTDPHIPPARAAFRVTLWWVVYSLSIFTATGIFMTLAGRASGDPIGGIIAITVLLGALWGVTTLLRKEIGRQRRILRQPELEGNTRVSGSKVSSRHVRKIAVICTAVSIGFGIAIAVTPPASSPGTDTGMIATP
jgi:hypothetical protein